MILVLNSMEADEFADAFDDAMAPFFEKAGIEADFYRISKNPAVLDFSDYSHLIISGSEATAYKDHPWNEALETNIRNAVAQNKPILGICYGHQFLARTLAGVQYTRRSATPEFGWRKVEIKENPLFKGLKSPVIGMVSHYDEVFDLPEEFKVIASSEECKIHAFQYGDRPVYGVQFHPEYTKKEAEHIFQRVTKEDEHFPKYFSNPAVNDEQLLEAQPVIYNFFAM